MSQGALQALMTLMQQYGVADMTTWLNLLRQWYSEFAGPPLAEFRGRPAPVVRRYLTRQ